MSKPTSTYVAYGALAVTVCIWVGVGFFANHIQDKRIAYTARTAEAAKQANVAVDAAKLRILANNNIERASKLDTIMSSDVPMIVDVIKSVGTAAGVPIKISGALPTSVPKNQKGVQAVAFILESSGSFSSMMRVLALFESLPLPSSIEIIDLSREGQGGGASSRPLQTWHLNLKLRVITTATVSS
ncbi:hypothetical protein HYT05_01865 [Candidatus Kaiserbacteria bacterium]|nr:hypothetical protein [Candidatus Kaiserbacteria bacterium]